MPKPLFIKAGIVALPIILFLGLLANYLGLSGEKTVRYVVGDSSPFIQSLLPSERVGEAKNGEQPLLDEPVYFSVFAPPGGWETADVKLAFKTGSSSILELGALKDLFAQAFDFRPLANTVVENLEDNGWFGKPIPSLGENVHAFLRNELVSTEPAHINDSEIAVYRASLPWAPPKNPVKLPKGYAGSSYDLPLYGPQEFFIFKYDKGVSTLNVRYSDLNKTTGSDEVTLRVFSESGEVVAQDALPDDGDTSTDGKVNAYEFPAFTPLLEGLPQGVYRVVLSATSDIAVDLITTPSPYIAFKNSLLISSPRLCGAVIRSQHGCDLVLNTNAKAVTIQPLNADALEAVTFGSTSTSLNAVNEKTRLTSMGRDVTPIILPMSGAGGMFRITAEGFFSPATAPVFSPEPAGFSNFLVDPGAYKALAAYVPPQTKEGDWRVASASFDLSTLAKERGAYKFVLSAPLVKETDGGVEIHAIDITFKKPPLTLHAFLSSLKSFVKELIW